MFGREEKADFIGKQRVKVLALRELSVGRNHTHDDIELIELKSREKLIR